MKALDIDPVRVRRAYAGRLAAMGDVLRHFRENAGISQTELASRLGMNQPTISKVESGGGATLYQIFTIAQYFGMTVGLFDPNLDGEE